MASSSGQGETTFSTADLEGGLDLRDCESWSVEEENAFREWYLWFKEQTMPGHDLWIEFRPDVLKRYRAYAVEMTPPEERAFAKIGTFGYLHQYAIIGYEDGISYQITNLRKRGGATKDEVLAVLALAFLHSGPLGMRYVASSALQQLREYEDPEPTPWPAGWAPDAAAFISGMDFTRRELTTTDRRRLEAWYERVCGEVPEHVRFLAEYAPAALKAYRHRFEYSVKDKVPKQLVPVVQLHWEVVRGNRAGIREAALTARGFGVQKAFAVGAIARAIVYAGPAGAAVVSEAAGDVLVSWT